VPEFLLIVKNCILKSISDSGSSSKDQVTAKNKNKHTEESNRRLQRYKKDLQLCCMYKKKRYRT